MLSDKKSSHELEALKRKERLLQLKRKRLNENTGEGSSEDQNENSQSSSRPIFRSYNPTDESLRSEKLPAIKPIELIEEISKQIDSTKEAIIVDEIDLTSLAPRKQNWDLKKDLNRRLEKFERKTQRAIIDLIRERLSSGKADLLLTAVNASVECEQNAHLSDED
uniref:Coiled-coil domain-containing protein 12 n=1 Tax=Romanomermis culicivorax TaxID=13658 RepID=A0A915KCY0_ROMCU